MEIIDNYLFRKSKTVKFINLACELKKFDRKLGKEYVISAINMSSADRDVLSIEIQENKMGSVHKI
jgi:hypothetical protein